MIKSVKVVVTRNIFYEILTFSASVEFVVLTPTTSDDDVMCYNSIIWSFPVNNQLSELEFTEALKSSGWSGSMQENNKIKIKQNKKSDERKKDKYFNTRLNT